MESKFTTSPPSDSARKTASADLPVAVDPTITNIGQPCSGWCGWGLAVTGSTPETASSGIGAEPISPPIERMSREFGFAKDEAWVAKDREGICPDAVPAPLVWTAAVPAGRIGPSVFLSRFLLTVEFYPLAP